MGLYDLELEPAQLARYQEVDRQREEKRNRRSKSAKNRKTPKRYQQSTKTSQVAAHMVSNCVGKENKTNNVDMAQALGLTSSQVRNVTRRYRDLPTAIKGYKFCTEKVRKEHFRFEFWLEANE